MWKDSPYPGYKVTENGKVRGPSGVLAPSRNGTGYDQVTISTEWGRFRIAVHVLVCETFHGPRPTPRSRCTRKDGDRQNNSADNLFWKNPTDGSARGGTISSYLPGDEFALLEARCEELGVSRSAFIQEAVRVMLGHPLSSI